MLIPQFSIRWLFAITAACAGVFSIVALGVRGHRWALGVSLALASLVVLMVVYAALFCLVWAFASLMGRSGGKDEQAASLPFTPSAVPADKPLPDSPSTTPSPFQ